MKLRFVIVLIVIASLTLIIYANLPKDVDFNPMEIEGLDIDIQNAINEIKDPGIYFITKDQKIILYSNLQKSGLYTYPYAEIKKDNNNLIVRIKSHMATNDDMVKEILIGRIEMEKLPTKIESYFLGQRIESQTINLNR